MIAYLDEHPPVGIAGCRIVNAAGEVEHSTHSFPTVLKEFIHANEFTKAFVGYDSVVGKSLSRILKSRSLESYWDHDSIREVDHVTGACMMVRREAIEKVGLLDEAFFLYNEEVEWSYRMKQAGYKSVFLPDSDIVHLFGHSTKQRVQKQVANELLLERYRGMFYFFQKHYGPVKLLLLKLIVAEGFALRLALSYIKRLDPLRGRPIPLDETIYMRKILMLVFVSNFDWRRKP
jgi:GT2 family glycosyltransferase